MKFSKEPFAKLFEVEGGGQIVAILTISDDGCPQVRVSFCPEGLGICEFNLSFLDTDEGWKAADAAFEKCTEESLTKRITKMMDETGLVDS